MTKAILLLTTLALALGACGCPPRVVDHSTPEATLATWQAHLCRDLPQVEYACLASDFRREIGGFGTYVAWRDHLLDTEPVLAAIASRSDFSDNVVASGIDREGRHGWLVLSAMGERMRLEFEREVWVEVRFGDGRPDAVLRQPGRFDTLIARDGPRQWLLLDRPELRPEDVARIESICYDSRWLIRSFAPEVVP